MHTIYVRCHFKNRTIVTTSFMVFETLEEAQDLPRIERWLQQENGTWMGPTDVFNYYLIVPAKVPNEIVVRKDSQ